MQGATTVRVQTYSNQLVSIQDKAAQQADNSSHTGAAKVLDNSQQYIEWRIGTRGHDKLVELSAATNVVSLARPS